MEATEKTCAQMLKDELAKVNKRIDKVFDKFIELKDDVNERIDKFIQKHEISESMQQIQQITVDIEAQKKEMKDMIEGYQMFQSDTNQEQVGKKEKHVLKQDFDAQNKEISNLTQNIEKFRQDYDSFRNQFAETCNRLDEQKTEWREITDLNHEVIDNRVKELLANINYNNNNDNNNNHRSNDNRSSSNNNNKSNNKNNKNNSSSSNSNNGNGNGSAHNNNLQPKERRKLYEGRDIDVVFCMDSNSKHILFKKLWTVKNTVRRRCYTQQQLKQYITDLHATSIKYFLIHVGVNDIDHAGGDEVFKQIMDNIELLKQKYPEIKIVLAELTPRMDNKDAAVNKCNELLNHYAELDEKIFIASHESLRGNKTDFLADNKHISRKTIGVFVVNLKRALCQAHGIPYFTREEYEQNRRAEQNALATITV